MKIDALEGRRKKGMEPELVLSMKASSNCCAVRALLASDNMIRSISGLRRKHRSQSGD
jgi:hypothetical protein